MTDLAPQLITLIAEEVSTTGQPIEADTDLLISGTVDSLGVVRIVHWLEERCGLAVDPADVTLENFQTVAAIVRYVERRQDAAA